MTQEYLIMAAPGFKSKKSEVLSACIDFVFGFENKKGEILDHWISFLDSFNFPPQEFYEAIEKELQERHVPNLTISREEFSEGGMLSDRRIYLRLFRERLALYTCAAPFGTGYFFSCRTVYVPALVRLWHILAALGLFALIIELLIKPLGLVFSCLAVVTLMFALAATLRNAAASALSDFDGLLLKIPIVATFYEDWFRADTYWRADAQIVYLQRLPALIKEVAAEITAAKGVKLVNQFQRAPILGQLYKPLPSNKSPESA
jgi:hypothetical protein